MADVVIDIPMEAEEVVRCFSFEEKRYLNLRFGTDQIGLQFNNPANNNNNTLNINTTPTTTNEPQEDKPASEEGNENEDTTNKNNINNNINNNNKQMLLYSPGPIMRHKLEANRSYARRMPTRNFIGAARRLHRQAVDNSQHQLEMDRLTNDFKSKIKVNRKKKIEMRTFKKAIMDLDM